MKARVGLGKVMGWCGTVMLCMVWCACSKPIPRQDSAGAKRVIKAVPVISKADALPPTRTCPDTCVTPPVIVPRQQRSGSYTFAGQRLAITPPLQKPAGMLASLVYYGADEGLFSQIKCMYKDREGNIWYGTEGAGVIRYNGRSFTGYNTAHGLAGNVVLSIAEDKAGNMWFGTVAGGVSRYNGHSFTTITTADMGIGYYNNSVSCITVTSNGHIWFGTIGGGACRFDGQRYTAYSLRDGMGRACNGDCMGIDVVYDIADDGKGGVWICLGGGGIAHYDGKRFINYGTEAGLASNVVTCAHRDRSGQMWLGTNAGVSAYAQGRFTSYGITSGLAGSYVTDILQDIDGVMWIATTGGLSRLEHGAFTTVTTREGLTDDRLTSLVQDRGGYLWLGSAGGGAMRYDRGAFTLYTTQQGLPSNAITSVAEDNKGHLWLGTAGAGVCRMGDGLFTTYGSGQGLPFGWVQGVTATAAGDVWVGTGGTGATCINNKSLVSYGGGHSVVDGTVYSIKQSRKGAIWLCTFNGIHKYDSNIYTTLNVAQGLCHSRILCAAEDAAGRMWFGSAGGGVCCYDGVRFTSYGKAQGLAGNNVPCLLADKAGNIWMGSTDGGLTRYDGHSFMTLTTADGLASNVIADITEDSTGNIWVGTQEGFTVLTGLLHNSTGRTIPANAAISNSDVAARYSPVFELYNFRNGYPVRDVAERAMLAGRNGIIWAGTGERLVRFDRRLIYRDTAPPVVRLQSLKINGRTICWHALPSKTGRRSSTTADSMAIVNEALTTTGNVLSSAAIDTLRADYSDVLYDSIAPGYAVPYGLVLPYSHNNITIDFGVVDPARGNLAQYKYMLEGYNKKWSIPSRQLSVTFGNIQEGVYTLRLMAMGADGVWSKPLVYTFTILPPPYRTWWAYMAYACLIAGGVHWLLRIRTRKLLRDKERLEQIVIDRTEDVVKEKHEVEKQKAAVDDLLVQKDMLMKEIHHRVKNNLQIISTLLDLQLEQITDNNARKALTEGMSRINSISLIHQQLYRDDKVAIIHFRPFVSELMSQVASIFNRPGQDVAFVNNIDDALRFNIDTAIPLGLILNELITNSYKYAFGNDPEGTIKIEVSGSGPNYKLLYKDSGPGLPHNMQTSEGTSLGMTVINSLSQQLDGSFEYNREQGVFVVCFVGVAG